VPLCIYLSFFLHLPFLTFRKDAVLLRHVLQQGTRQWATSRQPAALPYRGLALLLQPLPLPARVSRQPHPQCPWMEIPLPTVPRPLDGDPTPSVSSPLDEAVSCSELVTWVSPLSFLPKRLQCPVHG